MSLGMAVLFCMGIFALGYLPVLVQDSQSNWLVWLAPIGFAVSFMRVVVMESVGAYGYLGLLVGSWCAWLLLALWFGHRNQRYSYHSMGTYLKQGVVLVILGGVLMQCVIALYFALFMGGSRNLFELARYIYGL
jgi:hypothetical protein